MRGGGAQNYWSYLHNPDVDISGIYNNAPQNIPNIETGFKSFNDGSFSAISPVGNGASIDDPSLNPIASNTSDSAAAQLAAQVYPYPQTQVASGDDNIPPSEDTSAATRTQLAGGLATQLAGMSGNFQAYTQSDGTVIVTGDNGSVIKINPDSSGSKYVPIDANGSYRQTEFDSNGQIQTTHDYLVTNGADTDGNSSQHIEDKIYSGSDIDNIISQSTTDVTIDSQGSVHKNVSNSDGSSSSDTYNADGSSTGTARNSDGTSLTYNDDGQGNITIDSFNANGAKDGDGWTKADGSYGTNTFNPDGSSKSHSVSTDKDGVTTTDDKTSNTDGSYTDNWSATDGSYGYSSYRTGILGNGIVGEGDSYSIKYYAGGLSVEEMDSLIVNYPWEAPNPQYSYIRQYSSRYTTSTEQTLYNRGPGASLYVTYSDKSTVNFGFSAGGYGVQIYDASTRKTYTQSLSPYLYNGQTVNYVYDKTTAQYQYFTPVSLITYTLSHPDGSKTVVYAAPQSIMKLNNYDAEGHLVSDSWEQADSLMGRDTFYADGSSSGVNRP